MKTLNDIKQKLADRKSDLFSRYPLRSLAIFGSFSREEQNEVSDLDIIVEFNDKIGIVNDKQGTTNDKQQTGEQTDKR